MPTCDACSTAEADPSVDLWRGDCMSCFCRAIIATNGPDFAPDRGKRPIEEQYPGRWLEARKMLEQWASRLQASRAQQSAAKVTG